MALIKTQSALKRAIFAKKETLSEEELFTSNAYGEFLTQIIKGCVPGYQPNVYVRKMEHVAFTDGESTCIGLNNPFVDAVKTTVEKNRCYVGLTLHETGHILFTDFALSEKVLRKLSEGALYPKMEEIPEEKREDILALNPNTVAKYLMNISNCLEDGYVDRIMMKLIPGYGKSLHFIRSLDRKNTPSYAQMKKEGLDDWMIFLNCVLFYARFGYRPYSDAEEEEELVKALKPCEKIIAKAVTEPIPMKRMKYSWLVFSAFIDFINSDPKKERGGEESGESSDSESESKEEDGKPSESTSGESSSTSSESTEEERKEERREKIEEKLEKTADSLKDPERETKRALKPSPSAEAMDKAKKVMSEADADMSSSKKEKTPEEDKGLEKIKTEAAEEGVAKDQEAEIEKKLLEGCKGLDTGIHEGVTSEVIRPEVSTAGRLRYEKKHLELDTEVKRFIKEFQKEIEERQIGGTQTGLYFGKDITVSQVYRRDKRIFNNKIAPEDIPDMVVGVLVDLSGSMSSGVRMDRARDCAYITYRFCKEMGIPVFVIGHDVHFKTGKMRYHSVADENSLDGKDEKRIFSLEPYGDNRDGLALRYCYKKLEEIDAEQKILCVISDGQPADSSSKDAVGYHKHNGAPDMREAVKSAKKSGIETIVAGIGGDADSIKECYKRDVSDKYSATFLDFSDMHNLSKCFIRVLKRMLD